MKHKTVQNGVDIHYIRNVGETVVKAFYQWEIKGRYHKKIWNTIYLKRFIILQATL